MTDIIEQTKAPEQARPLKQTLMERPNTDLMASSPFASRDSFELAQRMATMLSTASIIPDTYRAEYLDKDGKWVQNPDAVGNCFIALELANRLKLSPLLIMQNVDMIHGRPGMRGVLLIALINGSGEFADLEFECNELDGDEYGWRAVSTKLSTGVTKFGTWITWKMVKAEGWSGKKGSKWMTMADQMFCYRAASFWSRLHAPHITLGIGTSEELEDTLDVVPSPSAVRVALINERLDAIPDKTTEAADSGNAAEQVPPPKEAPPKRRRSAKAAEPPPQDEPRTSEADPADIDADQDPERDVSLPWTEDEPEREPEKPKDEPAPQEPAPKRQADAFDVE